MHFWEQNGLLGFTERLARHVVERKPRTKQAETQVPLPRLCLRILPLISLVFPSLLSVFPYKERLDLQAQQCSCVGHPRQGATCTHRSAGDSDAGSCRLCPSRERLRGSQERRQSSGPQPRSRPALENEPDPAARPLLAGAEAHFLVLGDGDWPCRPTHPSPRGPSNGKLRIETTWKRSCCSQQAPASQAICHTQSITSYFYPAPAARTSQGRNQSLHFNLESSKCFKSTKYMITSPIAEATLIRTIDALNESFLAKTLGFWYLLPSSARQSSI